MQKIKLPSRPGTNHVQGPTSFSGSVPNTPSTTCKQKTSATLFKWAKTEDKDRIQMLTEVNRTNLHPENTSIGIPKHVLFHATAIP